VHSKVKGVKVQESTIFSKKSISVSYGFCSLIYIKGICASRLSSAQLTTPNLSPSLLVKDPINFWCPAATTTSERRDNPVHEVSAADHAARSKNKRNKSRQVEQ
jgi:hypothetical protein